MHKNSLLQAMVCGLLLVGCAGSAQMHGSASISTPELVYVSPGVQVIADYREPIFYSDSYYWRFSGNVWYRSSNHTRGWVRYQAPAAVLRIERPSAYIHYRGSASASTGPAQRDAPQATPAMTREERKDVKEAQKEERKEERQELKAAQKEEREERKEERKEDRKDAKKDRK
jgi:hypothetical protein